MAAARVIVTKEDRRERLKITSRKRRNTLYSTVGNREYPREESIWKRELGW